jgi:glycosyltransferase involved in cell wall biosynthesis
MKPSFIQISICTYQRPKMLKECLASVLRTQIPDRYRISITIIDNDKNQSAKLTVRKLAENAPIKVDYVTEPRRGIPMARNKALDQALSHNIDYLAFIDDDELVSENWLISLTNYLDEKGGNAVIHGRVISQCPENTPKYLAPFFTKRLLPTGTEMDTCATDNVLFSLQPARIHNLRFDESLALDGGDDTLFFSRMHTLGTKIFSCTEAIVYEPIPLSRISLRWLSQRKYRVGAGIARRKISADAAPFKLIVHSLSKIIAKLFSCLFHLLRGQKKKSVQAWLKGCQSAGTIGGILGIRYNEYKTIHGS